MQTIPLKKVTIEDKEAIELFLFIFKAQNFLSIDILEHPKKGNKHLSTN